MKGSRQRTAGGTQRAPDRRMQAAGSTQRAEPSSLAPRPSPLVRHSCFLVLCLAAAGCGQDIDTIYGQRKGPAGASTSVNGTAVLAKMFQQAGHTVFSWGLLSPRLRQRAECIVWFPDDFQPPSEKVRQWLEDWLEERPGRTLIYVGRDFDAAPWYWEKIEPGAPPDQIAEIKRRKSAAKTDFRADRLQIPSAEDCDWFAVEGKYQPRKVRSLEGDPDWLDGIDPARLEIELNGRMLPSAFAEVLLQSEDDMLVSVERWGESKAIVVANGSFLLNLPLVNHQHRKLAGKLIEQVRPPRKTVVFLESGSGGPPIFDKDPTAGPPSGLEIFSIWPTSWILLHLVIVGVIFCFSRFPIFGRPHEPQPEGTLDFGKHVQALGELFQRSGDTAYAMSRLSHYQQTTAARDTGPRRDRGPADGKSIHVTA